MYSHGKDDKETRTVTTDEENKPLDYFKPFPSCSCVIWRKDTCSFS